MASHKIGALSVDFTLETENALKGLKETQKQLTDFQKIIQPASKLADDFGKSLKSVGTGLTIGITVPLAAAGASIIKFGGDFDQAMTQSLAIMGDVSDGMRRDMVNAAKSMAETTVYSASQSAESFYFLASAGLDAKASIAALPVVASFAQAGVLGLAQASEFLTDATSSLGLAMKDDAVANMQNMIRVSDVLVQAANKSNASVQQFAEALTNEAGSALRNVNKSVEEGVAVLSVFADKGVKGAEAGTKLAIVMRDLQDKALDNAAQFKHFNVAVFDSNGTMRNMADIIGDLEQSLAGASDAQKKMTLSTLGFQDKSVGALLTLLGTSNAIRAYEKDLRSAAGITAEVAEKQMASFQNQMKLLGHEIENASITLFETFAPLLKNTIIPAVHAVTGVIQGAASMFANLAPPLQLTALGLAAVAAGLGPVLYIGGSALRWAVEMQPVMVRLAASIGSGGLSAALSAAAGQLSGFAAPLAALGGPAGAIALAAAAVVAGVIIFRQFHEATREVSEQLKFMEDRMASTRTSAEMFAEIQAKTAKGQTVLAVEIELAYAKVRAEGKKLEQQQLAQGVSALALSGNLTGLVVNLDATGGSIKKVENAFTVLTAEQLKVNKAYREAMTAVYKDRVDAALKNVQDANAAEQKQMDTDLHQMLSAQQQYEANVIKYDEEFHRRMFSGGAESAGELYRQLVDLENRKYNLQVTYAGENYLAEQDHYHRLEQLAIEHGENLFRTDDAVDEARKLLAETNAATQAGIYTEQHDKVIALGKDIIKESHERSKEAEKEANRMGEAFSNSIANLNTQISSSIASMVVHAKFDLSSLVGIAQSTAQGMLSAFLSGLISPLTNSLAKLGQSIGNTISQSLGLGGAGGGSLGTTSVIGTIGTAGADVIGSTISNGSGTAATGIGGSLVSGLATAGIGAGIGLAVGGAIALYKNLAHFKANELVKQFQVPFDTRFGEIIAAVDGALQSGTLSLADAQAADQNMYAVWKSTRDNVKSWAVGDSKKQTVADQFFATEAGVPDWLDWIDAITIAKGGVKGSLYSFAKGIDFVPHDMLAEIHQGERVVPAAANKVYGGGVWPSPVPNAAQASVNVDATFNVAQGAVCDEVWFRSTGIPMLINFIRNNTQDLAFEQARKTKALWNSMTGA